MEDLVEQACPFCTIEESLIVAQNATAIAFRDAYPIADGHTLVMKVGFSESCRMDDQRLERINHALQIAGPASVLADGVAAIG